MEPTSRLFSMGIALLLAVAGGCGGPDGWTTGALDEPIIGGVVDANDGAVVLLFAQKPASNQGYLCSGTLIAPTVVVTAAHCVSPQSVGAGDHYQVFSGTDWTQGDANAWTEVAEVHWDAAFNPKDLEAGHDIAVAILARPSATRPLPRNRTALDGSLVGKAARVLGFGVSDARKGTGVGVKRAVATTLDEIRPSLVRVGDSSHQSCEGDSGGPALMTLGGVETLVGVTSYGQVGCVGGGWHTRVDAYAAFLDTYAPPAPLPTPAPVLRKLARKK